MTNLRSDSGVRLALVTGAVGRRKQRLDELVTAL
jgi:hypothetical protein